MAGKRCSAAELLLAVGWAEVLAVDRWHGMALAAMRHISSACLARTSLLQREGRQAGALSAWTQLAHAEIGQAPSSAV